MKWSPELNLQASTYHVRSLFDVPPLNSNDVRTARNGELAVSPNESWCYCEKVFPRGHLLATAKGSNSGSVLFDGDVLIPSLHQRGKDGWIKVPWMSLTPMEIMTLRPGTRRAKGRVIVAGLGLGHQLIEVSLRKKVTHLTLVEKERELVDWLLPRLDPFLGRTIDELVIGDAYVELPKMEADAALVDIFQSYGGNSWERDRLARKCPGINFMWAWGAPYLREGHGWD